MLCMQEIFTGPYFCAEQNTRWYDSVEKIPDGPTTKLMQEYAKKYNMVIVVPIYEEEDDRRLLQHRRRDRRRRHVPRQVPQEPHPARRPRLLGEVLLPPRQPRLSRSSRRAYGKVGVYICYDRHFPEGARELGLAGAEIVFNPSATVAGLSEYLWKLEQPAHAVANGYFVGAINRVGYRSAVEHRRVLRPELLLRSARPDPRHRPRATRTRSSPRTSTSTRSAKCATPGSSTAIAGRRRTTGS